MFCIHCGAENPEEASFCSACGKNIGTPAELPGPSAATPPQRGRSSQPLLWILAGFAGCLLLVITVALGFRLSQDAPAQEPPRGNPAPVAPATAIPSTETAPAALAPDVTSAPAIAPVQVPPPAPPTAPLNPIVGEWRATTIVGSSIVLHFGPDGRYSLKDLLDSQEGVYVFSTGDGTLRLQPNALFSHDVVIWNCQLSGDSLSCVDPDGAGHVYSRVQ